MNSILNSIIQAKKESKKQLAQLLDPDKIKSFDHLSNIVGRAEETKVDFFFFGGSLITEGGYHQQLKMLKDISKIPVILFPSNAYQINKYADAILFLSLISGRNPEFLIGQQTLAAREIKRSGIEVLPTGYLLIDCGVNTTAQYMSGTMPIPYEKGDIAASTALAGELLGLKLIYLDGGSGSSKSVSPEMIKAVREIVDIPIIVGGGVRSAQVARDILDAGADLIVVGNGAEQDMELPGRIISTMNNNK